MDSTRTKKRAPRPKKARSLLAVAGAAALAASIAVSAPGCSDEPRVITNPIAPPDLAVPVTTNPMPPDMAHD